MNIVPLPSGDARSMSSQMIAGITGKDHKNVTRDIKSVLAEAGIDALKFERIYKDGANRDQTCYVLPRRECDLVVSGYSPKYRLAIIDRWQELEKSAAQLTAPTLPEMLRIAAAAMEENEALKITVAEQTPKVDALKLLSISDGSTCIQQAAKALEIHPLKNLHQWMMEKRWIFRRGGAWVAHQDKIRSGHLEDKVTTVERGDGSSKVVHQTLVTPKGLAKLAECFSRKLEEVA